MLRFTWHILMETPMVNFLMGEYFVFYEMLAFLCTLDVTCAASGLFCWILLNGVLAIQLDWS